MPQDKPGIPKKGGWKERTKDFKTVIVEQPNFKGIVFMVGDMPLRKIGIEQSKIVIPGMPSQTVVNAAHKHAPPYRIVITKTGYRCYTKGLPSPIIH